MCRATTDDRVPEKRSEKRRILYILTIVTRKKKKLISFISEPTLWARLYRFAGFVKNRNTILNGRFISRWYTVSSKKGTLKHTYIVWIRVTKYQIGFFFSFSFKPLTTVVWARKPGCYNSFVPCTAVFVIIRRLFVRRLHRFDRDDLTRVFPKTNRGGKKKEEKIKVVIKKKKSLFFGGTGRPVPTNCVVPIKYV